MVVDGDIDVDEGPAITTGTGGGTGGGIGAVTGTGAEAFFVSLIIFDVLPVFVL